MTRSPPWSLFEVFGIELEYMIVGRDNLNVLPICDQLMQHVAGEPTSDVEFGPLSWSNELALHVLEIKTSEPVAAPLAMLDLFQQNVQQANRALRDLDACLLPSAMHPWMEPLHEMKLWPHENNAVYSAFDRLFDCRGHGWANLQSTHWNLPFRNDEEFGRLHAAVRLILPLLPALAASSPIVEGKPTGMLDTRLDVYRHNSRRIPSVAGSVVPEPVYTEQAYQEQIFQPMFQEIAPFDPEGTLQHVWLNARGAIARFDRGSIEIRVLDIQECPAADLAIGLLIVATLKLLCQETWTPCSVQQAVPLQPLAEFLHTTTKHGPQAIVPPFLAEQFGVSSSQAVTAGHLWQTLADRCQVAGTLQLPDSIQRCLDVVLQQGTLSQRILSTLGSNPSRAELMRVYRQLADCLDAGVMFCDT